MMLAITGGTGFVGKRLIDLALMQGHGVRALTRRDQPFRDGVTWVDGALDRPDALADLVSGADAVIHVAGVVNAPDRATFASGNIAGTQALVAAVTASGIARFVHVSSLAAREPTLSLYGWSKAEGDALVTGSTLDWTIVRPPAIYGPGDLDMLDLFKLARFGLALLPPGGRMSLIHVDDLARLLIALATSNGPHAILEPSDGVPGGYSHPEFARAIGKAVGRSVLTIPLPRFALALAAAGDRLIRRDGARLTPDRVDYFCHPNWTSDPAKASPPALWSPAIDTPAGLAATAAWYREHGLL